MTLTIDHPTAGDGGVSEPSSAAVPADISLMMRIGLAALALGPAAIHFAMIPSHAAESSIEAIGFAIAAWLGALLGIGTLVRPSRRLLIGTVVLNVAMVAIWIRSRTAGLPFGDHSGHKEAATGIDILATGMEVAAIVACVALLARPGLGRRLGVAGGVIGGAVAGFAMVASSVALASPSARDHASHSHGDTAAADGTAAHDHGADATGIHEGLLAEDGAGATSAAATGATAADGSAEDAGHSHGDNAAATGGTADAGHSHGTDDAAGNGTAAVGGGSDDAAAHDHGMGAPVGIALGDRCDLGLNPVSFWQENNIVHNGAAGEYAGSAELDELITATTKPGGEAKDAEVVARLGRASDETYDAWLNWLPAYVGASHAHAASTGAPDDNGGHGGHLGPQSWIPMTDQAECDELNAQLDQARQVAMKYPHPGDAEAAGWRRVTGYVPGIAAHYMNFGYVDGRFNISEPEMLLYDGTDANASIVGLSYYLLKEGDYEPTQGFAGPNDHFHRHIGLCVNGTGVIGDSTLSDEECAARGGQKQGGSGGWMNHVWIVPGCESPWGMFSGASPTLDRQLTEKSGTDGGGCAGSGVYDRFDLTPGTVENLTPILQPEPADA